MIVNYDLCKRPTTFDFASFCVFAGTLGAKHVHFQLDGPIEEKKYAPEIGWRRFGNILLPLAKLARMSWTVGAGQRGEVLPRSVHNMGNVNSCFLSKGGIHKLQKTCDAEIKQPYVTITIRDSFRGDSIRNSNRPAWEMFRQQLKSEGFKVVVLDECETRPIDLEWRMAAYAGAVMNFGVNNGPMTLCFYSDAPYIVMKQGIGTEPEENFPEGSQFDFANGKQRLFWQTDSYENIKAAWKSLRT